MFLLKVILYSCLLLTTLAEEVTYLESGVITNYRPLERRAGFLQNELRIYCYRGAAKTLPRLFESVELQLEIADDDYTQYEGITPAEVRKHYDEHRSLFSFNIFSQKRPRLQISPFGQHCIGIEATQSYRVRLQQTRVDFWRVIQLTIGIVVFIYASQLSQNSVFFYMAGITFGICASFMLLVWLASKLVPRRPVMYGVIIGGWTVGIYLLQLLWENIQAVVVTYRTYVFWYLLTTGLISFLFCYRWGPPENRRSKNIIKWTLQFLALVCIYLSSYFEEATVAIIVITALLHYFPRSMLLKIRSIYLRKFPPKRRFLTNEEYYEEGVKETTKALEELRKYASSPDCKQWRLISHLKDPMRFAAFVEGASHLRDEEILRFEGSNMEDNYDDDSDSERADEDVPNGIEEEISDDEEYPMQIEQNFHETRRMSNRFVKNTISPRNSTLSPRYTAPYETNNARITQPRTARISNAATSSNYLRNRYSRTYSNSENED